MRRYGRIRSLDTSRSLPFRRYLAQSEIDAAPPARDWIGANTSFPLFGNDAVGDCTCAALFDRRVLISRLDGEPAFAATTADCEAVYTAVTGWDGVPGSPTDHGAQPINVLEYAKASGIGGTKIGAFVRLNFDAQDEMRAALNLLGPIYCGAGLPKALDDQGFSWDMPPIAERDEDHAPDPDRGHMFILGGYDRLGWSVVTWGSGLYRASNAWATECIDECYALLDDAWVTGTRGAPNGFDLSRLLADMASL